LGFSSFASICSHSLHLVAMCTPTPVVLKKVSRRAENTYFSYPQGQGPWFRCEPDADVKPRICEAGLAGPDTVPTTLPMLMEEASSNKGIFSALLVERPLPALQDGKAPEAFPRHQWTRWSWKQYRDDVRAMAKCFMKYGCMQYDTVNIWGFNAPEWSMAALAAMYCGGKCGGIYPTDTGDTAAFKAVQSGGVITAVEGRSQLNKLVSALNARGDCRRMKLLISWMDVPNRGEQVEITGCGKLPFISWSDALKFGQAESDSLLNLGSISPGHCAAIIYTSGTTGEPKGVMCSHDSLSFVGKAVTTEMNSTGFGTSGEERGLSYLPLSHIAGLMIDIVGPMSLTARNPGVWESMFFARPYDLKAGSIGDRLKASKPTVFFGVPLVWEKMADRVKAIGAASTGMKKTISDWAKAKALEHAKTLEIGCDPVVPSNFCFASRFLGLVKGAVGLDKCKIAASGAAPMRKETLEYFASLNIHINEGYGMSESVLGASFSTPIAHQWGSCGYELTGYEVKIYRVDGSDLNKKVECLPAPALDNTDEEYQGEICFRGRGIMMGYLANKDMGDAHVAEINKKTAETIDADGWLHSGDKGLKTALGMIKITGRFKELIIGDGGENIAPVPIEDSVKGFCAGINEVMMIGDKRKYNVAVITLKAIGANGEVPGTDQLDAGAKNVNADVTTITGALTDKVWIETISNAIVKTNANQKIVLNPAFKIQKFTILPLNFSEENGELTPTKKLKRATVEKKYAQLIDYMYATEGNKMYEHAIYIPFKDKA